MCGGSGKRGRARVEYSRRIIPYYLPTVNRHCEVLASNLVGSTAKTKFDSSPHRNASFSYKDGILNHTELYASEKPNRAPAPEPPAKICTYWGHWLARVEHSGRIKKAAATPGI